MSIAEVIQPHHRSRQAILYVRQSTPNQIFAHQESLKLQYALADRARAYGWDDVHVIDTDLGLTARSAQGRPGFQELVTLVTLEQVGIIFAYDVTRLARNCTDWYQLLDLCGYRRCLVGDQDGVYDPATVNGRLILGLKGLISELELHTIRARLTAGLFSKAQRGELALTLPTGLMREPSGQVVKHPDREVQSRLELVFETFLRVKTVTKVVRSFNEQHLRLPRRNYVGDIVWRTPTIATVATILKNPAYAGTFVYGRTRATPKAPDTAGRTTRRLPVPEWKICLRDRYPAYIDWVTFEKIQAMIRDNYSEYDKNKTRGVPRPGKALLHGIVWCGECGHKLVVQYKNGTRYICNFLRQKYQVPVCQCLPADPVDDYVVGAFFAALAPVELDLCGEALAAASREQEQWRRAHQQQLERLRYQASLAERQYQKADPDNRLVTAELEKRWEMALRELKSAEEEWQRLQVAQAAAGTIDPSLRAAFADVARGLPELWRQGRLSHQHRKALLRCLIDKVILHRSAPDTIHTRIVWRGGDTTTTDIPIVVSSVARLSCGQELERVALELARQGLSDEVIAEELTRRGYRSPRETKVIPSTVRGLRLKHRLLRPRPGSRPRRMAGKLTLPQVARLLSVPLHWLYQRIERGVIEVPLHPERKLYLFPDTPEALALLQQLKAGLIESVRL
ncbi:MAG TPA: recombinase family protein [Gemmataceae bacterium]|jgi:DNA invertase Pin-like site-specific DNA recombinase|nr:recombinase family protein [Gemmataceae bacterium]